MSVPEIRSATEADLPTITEIYEHAVRYGTATFELIPPDLAEMTRRFTALMDGGFVVVGDIPDDELPPPLHAARKAPRLTPPSAPSASRRPIRLTIAASCTSWLWSA